MLIFYQRKIQMVVLFSSPKWFYFSKITITIEQSWVMTYPCLPVIYFFKMPRYHLFWVVLFLGLFFWNARPRVIFRRLTFCFFCIFMTFSIFLSLGVLDHLRIQPSAILRRKIGLITVLHLWVGFCLIRSLSLPFHLAPIFFQTVYLCISCLCIASTVAPNLSKCSLSCHIVFFLHGQPIADFGTCEILRWFHGQLDSSSYFTVHFNSMGFILQRQYRGQYCHLSFSRTENQ